MHLTVVCSGKEDGLCDKGTVAHSYLHSGQCALLSVSLMPLYDKRIMQSHIIKAVNKPRNPFSSFIVLKLKGKLFDGIFLPALQTMHMNVATVIKSVVIHSALIPHKNFYASPFSSGPVII